MVTANQNSANLENNLAEIRDSMKEIIRESMKELLSSMNEEFNKVMNKFDQLMAANERGLKVISEMKTSGLDREELKAAEYDENDDLGEKVLDCQKEDVNQRVQPIAISHEELGVMDAHKVFDKSPEREVDRQLITDKVNSLPVCDNSFLNFVENTVTLRTNKIEIVSACTVMNYFMYHQQNSFLELKHGREKLLVFDPGGEVFYPILILPIAKCQQAQISIIGRIVCAKLSDIFLKEGFTTAGFGQTSLGSKAVNGVFTRAWYTLLNYLDPMIISLFDAFYNWKFSDDNLQASGLVNLKIDETRMIIFDPGGVIYNMMDARRAWKTYGCSWVEIESYMHSFLAAICSWLNEIKHNYHWRWSSPLHYVETPDFRCNYKYCRDCHNYAGHNDRCVTATIYTCTKKLELGVNDLNSEIKAFELGLLAKANRGILFVDEVNLLDDHLLDDLLDSAALGWNTVEREEILITHPARFILVDSGNLEEGELRPQLLGRFGMKVQVSRASLSSVQINHELRVKISKVCAELNVDGLSSTDAIIFHIPPAWALVFKLKFESGGAVLNLGLLLWYNVNLFGMYVKHSSSCEKDLVFVSKLADDKLVIASLELLWVNEAEMHIDFLKYGWNAESTILLPLGQNIIDSLWMSETGFVDAFFCVDPGPKDVVKQYFSVTGTPAMPQLFATAYHQCKWNYRDEEDVQNVDSKFDEHDIPYNVLWLDIEHMDGKKYFTWDRVLCPNPEEMQKKLVAKGRKMITIVYPYIKRDNSYYIHKEASEKGHSVKDATGRDFDGWCWPGSSLYLDMVNAEIRSWWATKFSYQDYVDSTHSLYNWNDMNEPSVFNGPEVTMPRDALPHGNVEHRELHNACGYYFHMATTDGLVKRENGKYKHFVLLRAFIPGSQRYGAVWTGDNTTEWDHLSVSVLMILTLGLAGNSFSSANVGGYFGNPEPTIPFLRLMPIMTPKKKTRTLVIWRTIMPSWLLCHWCFVSTSLLFVIHTTLRARVLLRGRECKEWREVILVLPFH